MSRIPISVGDLGMILIFSVVSSVGFGIWQHSVAAGIFVFALILVGATAGLESK